MNGPSLDILPVDRVVRRLAHQLALIDHLSDLLHQVRDGHQFVNRLGEAIVLIPEATLRDIERALGLDPL